jgi:hypothetical protein
MVGVINPNSTYTLARQVESARSADFEVAPGGKIPSEGTASLNAPESTGSTLPGQAHGSTGRHLSAGAIAGIVVGGSCFLLVCAALFFSVGRKSMKGILRKQNTAGMHARPPYHQGNRLSETGSSSLPQGHFIFPSAPPYHPGYGYQPSGLACPPASIVGSPPISPDLPYVLYYHNLVTRAN